MVLVFIWSPREIQMKRAKWSQVAREKRIKTGKAEALTDRSDTVTLEFVVGHFAATVSIDQGGPDALMDQQLGSVDVLK